MGSSFAAACAPEPATPYTYFVFVTLLTDREHVLAGMEAGADDYLVKPLDHYELRMRLIAAARVTDLHRRLRDSEHQRGRLEGYSSRPARSSTSYATPSPVRRGAARSSPTARPCRRTSTRSR